MTSLPNQALHPTAADPVLRPRVNAWSLGTQEEFDGRIDSNQIDQSTAFRSL